MLRLRRDMECRAAQRAVRPARPARVRPRARLARAARRHGGGCDADDEYALAEADREFHRRLFAEARLPNVEPLLLRCLIHNHRFKILNGRERHDLHHAARRHVADHRSRRASRDTAGLSPARTQPRHRRACCSMTDGRLRRAPGGGQAVNENDEIDGRSGPAAGFLFVEYARFSAGLRSLPAGLTAPLVRVTASIMWRGKD